MKHKKRVNKFLSTALTFVLLISTLGQSSFQKVDANEVYGESGGTGVMEIRGNHLKNPKLNYDASSTTIEHWKIFATDHIVQKGEKQVSLNPGVGYKNLKYKAKDIWLEKDILFPDYRFNTENPVGSTIPFTGKAYKNNSNSSGIGERRAFYQLSQTVPLSKSKKYYFKAEVSSNTSTEIDLLIYSGNKTSGDVGLINPDLKSFSLDDSIKVIEIPFVADEESVTVSLRHVVTGLSPQNGDLQIYSIGFYLEDDYRIQESVNQLFEDNTYSSLKYDTIESIELEMETIRAMLNDGTPYSEDVRAFVEEKIAAAQIIIDEIKAIQSTIETTYTNDGRTEVQVLTVEEREALITDLQNRIDNVTSEGHKADLQSELDRLSNVFEAQTIREDEKANVTMNADAYRATINALVEISQDEKDIYLAVIHQWERDTNAAIGEAITVESIQQLVYAADEAMQDQVMLAQVSDRKISGNRELKNEHNRLLELTHALEDLTQTQREQASLDFAEALANFQESVNDKATVDSINTEVTAGFDAFQTIYDQYLGLNDGAVQDTKNLELERLTQEYNTIKAHIENELPNLKPAEAISFLDMLETEYNTAIKAIHAATTKDMVSKAKNNGIFTMGTVKMSADAQAIVNLNEAKKEAKGVLDQAYETAMGELEALTSLTDNQVNYYNEQFTLLNHNAKNTIDTQVLVADIEMNTPLLETEIHTMIEKAILDNHKAYQKNTLDKYSLSINTQLEAIKNLQGTELEDALNEVKTSVLSDKSQIDEAVDEGTVDALYTGGLIHLDAIVAKYEKISDDRLEEAKTKALADIKAKYDECLPLFDSLFELETDELIQAKIDFATLLEIENEKINASETLDDVETTQSKGIKALEDFYADKLAIHTSRLNNAKSQAKQMVSDEANAQKAIIATLNNVTLDEKTAINAEIDLKVSEAQYAIDGALKSEDIRKHRDDGIQEIQNITIAAILSDAKHAALKEIDEKEFGYGLALEGLVDLSPESLALAQEKLASAYRDAQVAVNVALTPETVITAKETGIEAMKAVYDEYKRINDERVEAARVKVLADIVAEQAKQLDVIAELKELAPEDLQEAIDKINTQVEDSKVRIANGTTVADIEKMGQDTIEAIKTIGNDIVAKNQSLYEIKTEAKALLEEKRVAIEQAINAMIDVEDADRSQALLDLQQAYDVAIEDVQNQHRETDVNEARNRGLSAMDQVLSNLQSLVSGKVEEEKEVAKGSLRAYADEKIRYINEELTHLLPAQKDAAISEINNHVAATSTVIENAETIADVDTSLINGKANIDIEVSKAILQNEKEDAFKQLSVKEKEVSQKIADFKDILDSERSKAFDELKSAYETAKTNILGANDTLGVTKATSDGKLEMDRIVDALELLREGHVQDRKDQTIKDLEAYALAKKHAIDTMENLLPNQKALAKTQIDAHVLEAQDAIQVALDIESIENIYEQGMHDIDVEYAKTVLQDHKEAAYKALETKKVEVENAINALSDVALEERNSALALLETEFTKAYDAVKHAFNVDMVTEQKNLGITTMDQILKDLQDLNGLNLDEAIENALSDLRKYADDQKEIIKGFHYLSQTQTDAYYAEIEAIVVIGNTEISNATSSSEAKTALINAKNDIARVVVKAQVNDAKEQALIELEAKELEVRHAIDAIKDVFDEERNAALDNLLVAYQKSRDAVELATDVSSVISEKESGVKAMEQALTALKVINEGHLHTAKDDAKSELDKLAEAQKDIIDMLENLSEEEKQAAKDAIDIEIQKGKEVIDLATDIEHIETEVTKVQDNVAGILEDIVARDTIVKEAKEEALRVLSEKEQIVRDAINALTDVSVQERQDALAMLESEYIKAKESVNGATNVADVTSAKEIGLHVMDTILSDIQGLNENHIQSAKDDAKKELDQFADEQKIIIDALENLSEEEKQVAKDAIDNEIKVGKDAIDNATDSKNVNVEKDKTKERMNTITDAIVAKDRSIAMAKDVALKELADKEQAIRDRINALENVSDEARQNAIEALEKAYDDAKKTVNKAQSLEAVDSAKNKGMEAMDTILDNLDELDQIHLQAAKDAAIKALADRKIELESTINQMRDITESDRQNALEDLQKAFDDARTNILSAKNGEEIIIAKDQGIVAMEDIVSVLDALNAGYIQSLKENAKQELDKHAENQKALIDALTHLSEEEKQAARDAIDLEVIKGKDVIDNAVDGMDVEEKYSLAHDAIQTITDEMVAKDTALSDAKDAALKELADKEERVRDAINGLQNINDVQRQTALDTLTKEYTSAINDVNAGQTLDVIDASKLNGIERMNQVLQDVSVLDEASLNTAIEDAVKELEDYAQEQKTLIDEMDNLSEQEKLDAKAAIDELLNAGKEALENASSRGEISGIISDYKNQMTLKMEGLKQIESAQDKLPVTGKYEGMSLFGLMTLLVGLVISISGFVLRRRNAK